MCRCVTQARPSTAGTTAPPTASSSRLPHSRHGEIFRRRRHNLCRGPGSQHLVMWPSSGLDRPALYIAMPDTHFASAKGDVARIPVRPASVISRLPFGNVMNAGRVIPSGVLITRPGPAQWIARPLNGSLAVLSCQTLRSLPKGQAQRSSFRLGVENSDAPDCVYVTNQSLV